MTSKIKAQISHIFKTLAAVQSKIPSQVQKARVSADLDRLIKQTKQTVDKDELAVILKQAQGKLVMARIRFKDILEQVESAEEQQSMQYKSEAQLFQEQAQRSEENLKKEFEESTKNQEKVVEAYRKIADQIEKDSQGILGELEKNKAELNEAWDAIQESNKRAQKRRQEEGKSVKAVYIGKQNVILEGEEMLSETEKKVEKIQAAGDNKIEGFINVDSLSGSFEFEKKEDLQPQSERYVIRKGKLVKGKAKKREEAQFTNWHGGNADPEDVLRHRELLDRQHYKGPVWENQRPRSILESDLSMIADREGEEMPEVSEGKHEFEKIVR